MSSIKCTICNDNVGVKGFSTHLSKKHSIKFVDYVKQHMSEFEKYGWKWCDECHAKLARNFPSSKKKYATCSRECMVKHRETLWESGIVKHPRKGKVLAAETKEKISNTNKNRIAKNGHSWAGRKHKKETIHLLETIAHTRVNDPNYVNPMKGKTHTPESIAKICKDRVGSSLEVAVSELLMRHGYDFTHQFFITVDGKSYSYDFKLKGLPIIVEADGDYWHGGPGVSRYFFDVEKIKHNDEIKTQVANSRGYRVVRVWESEIASAPSVLLDRIHEALNESSIAGKLCDPSL